MDHVDCCLCAWITGTVEAAKSVISTINQDRGEVKKGGKQHPLETFVLWRFLDTF